jgi:hypothetical protein
VRALAIRDLVASKPLRWQDLPRVTVQERYVEHCLCLGDVVIPSRGDYYKAWVFEGADERVFPVGQLNVIRPGAGLNARYLVWYLNQASTQAKIVSVLTGTNIKALTKAALLSLEIALPPILKQDQIAEAEHVTQQIVATRYRLNELDKKETAYLTKRILQEGGADA